ncbi:MAG: hypothetical protein ABSB96_06795 [Gaiellaceae bacterium]
MNEKRRVKELEQPPSADDREAADELLTARGPGLNDQYTYDANGNQTQKGSTRYTYNLENQLTGLREGRRQVSYTYSGDGLMAKKTSGNDQVAYSWDSNAVLGQLVLEKDARRGTVLRSYTYGAGPLGITTRAGSYTYHVDRLDSVVALSDDRANSVASYRYTPYGEDWSSANSNRCFSRL